MEPREVNSVDRLIGLMKEKAPIPHDPGYVCNLEIINQNVWLIIEELERLQKKAAKKKFRPLEGEEDDEEYIDEILPKKQRKA